MKDNVVLFRNPKIKEVKNVDGKLICPNCKGNLKQCFGNYYFCEKEKRYLCSDCFNEVEDRGTVGTFIVCKDCNKVCYSD